VGGGGGWGGGWGEGGGGGGGGGGGWLDFPRREGLESVFQLSLLGGCRGKIVTTGTNIVNTFGFWRKRENQNHCHSIYKGMVKGVGGFIGFQSKKKMGNRGKINPAQLKKKEKFPSKWGQAVKVLGEKKKDAHSHKRNDEERDNKSKIHILKRFCP